METYAIHQKITVSFATWFCIPLPQTVHLSLILFYSKLLTLNKNDKLQENIPVWCVPRGLEATTRCQNWVSQGVCPWEGVGMSRMWVSQRGVGMSGEVGMSRGYPRGMGTYPMDMRPGGGEYPPHTLDIGPGIPTDTDKHLWKHYFPVTTVEGGKNSTLQKKMQTIICGLKIKC